MFVNEDYTTTSQNIKSENLNYRGNRKNSKRNYLSKIIENSKITKFSKGHIKFIYNNKFSTSTTKL